MQNVNCPLCSQDNAAPVFTAEDRLRLAPDSFTLVRCAGCGLVYLNPRPDDRELLGYYPETYWGDRQKGVREILRGLEERFKEAYKVRAVARAGLAHGRVLDVGCGRGEFLAMLRGKGFEVVGLEPGPEAARRGAEEYGLDIINGSLGQARLPEASFDAATLWHVLEHLPDPLGALMELRKALKPGGMLFVAAPDFGSWQAGRYEADWLGVDAPRHLTHFTRQTLSAMLSRAGFGEAVYHDGGVRYEAAMLVRSAWPGLNYKKLAALGAGRTSRYLYKAVQLALDAALLPAGLLIGLAGRGCTFVAVSRKV